MSTTKFRPVLTPSIQFPPVDAAPPFAPAPPCFCATADAAYTTAPAKIAITIAHLAIRITPSRIMTRNK